MQGIEIPIGAPLGQLDRDLNGAQKKLKQFTQTADKDVSNFSTSANSAFKSVALSLTGALSVGAFVSFGKEVLSVTAEFEKFGAVLGNTLGSNALASLKLKEIEEFAAKTPFGVKELTDSFVKLANQGFKPTGDEMRRLGDLAASTGKSFDQLAEGILDAQTGEFERLKEFGIRAQDAGDKVIFTFKGVQTTVDKSSEAIRNYITSLGDAEGVSGSMAVISETLTGKISNLSDSWDQMLVSVGTNTSGVFTSAIDIISEVIKSITEFNKELAIASKFNIKGNFLQSLSKYAKIGLAGAGANASFTTTQDFLVQAITRTDDKVSKLVSSSLSAAKSTDDFGKSISKLKTEGDNLIKGTANLDLKSAYKRIYEDAIKALQDGRNNFAAEASKPLPGNFGTAKKQKATKTEFNRDPQFKAQSSISELDLFLENYKKTADSLNKTPLVPFPKLPEKLAAINLQLIEFNKNANEIIVNSIANTFGQLGTSIGQALVEGGNVLNAVGQTILQGLTSFLSELGSELIKYGTLAVIKGKLDLAILTGGPVAIAAGLAAIGVGVALKAASGALGAAANKNNSSNNSVPTPQASSTISTSAAGSSQNFGGGTVVFEISGTNLIGVLNRAGAKLQRFGG